MPPRARLSSSASPSASLGLLAQPWLLSARHAAVLKRVAQTRLGVGGGGVGSGGSDEHVAGLALAAELRVANAERVREHFIGSLGGAFELSGAIGSDQSLSERDQMRGFALSRSGRVAVVPVHGLLVRHASMVNGTSQPEGMAYQQVTARVAAAIETGAQSVVLDIDSPGGTLAGAESFAREMVRLQEHTRVPVVAYAADMAASGAYVVMASCFGGAYCGATAGIGSIGVYQVVVDTSEAASAAGVKVHVISTGEQKGAFVDGAEVTDAHLKGAQDEINAAGEWFVGLVNAARGTTLVLGEAPADGSMLMGKAAVEAGLVDGVRSLRDVVEEMDGGR